MKITSPLVGLLTIAFVVLKLCSVIAWSWWWVLSPLWIAAGIIVAWWLVGILVLAVIDLRRARTTKRNRW